MDMAGFAVNLRLALEVKYSLGFKSLNFMMSYIDLCLRANSCIVTLIKMFSWNAYSRLISEVNESTLM